MIAGKIASVAGCAFVGSIVGTISFWAVLFLYPLTFWVTFGGTYSQVSWLEFPVAQFGLMVGAAYGSLFCMRRLRR